MIDHVTFFVHFDLQRYNILYLIFAVFLPLISGKFDFEYGKLFSIFAVLL